VGLFALKAPSLEAKRAYFAKVRRSNYLASLRLEGFSVHRSEASTEPPSREVVVNRYRKVKA